MTSELIARVDAWLEAHEVWAMATDERSGLAFVWFELREAVIRESRREAPSAPFVIAGFHSAMTGVLLALVREAWVTRRDSLPAACRLSPPADVYFRVDRVADGAGRATRRRYVVFIEGWGAAGWGGSLGEALVSALEAAPGSEVANG